MFKACRKSRVGKFFIWLAIKWNEYATNAARQALDYLRVERATFFHLRGGNQLAIATDVTSKLGLDYIFFSETTPSGRQCKFDMATYDPLARSELRPDVKRFMAVSYSVCGHRLTALYQDTKGVFPPYADFSVYEGLGERPALAQSFSLLIEDSKKEFALNPLLQECRGPAGHVSATPKDNWVASEGCKEHTWPLELLLVYAASQLGCMRALEERKIQIGAEQVG